MICERPGCTNEIVGKRRDARFCSDTCRHGARNAQRGPRTPAETRRAAELARQRYAEDLQLARARGKAKRDRLRSEIIAAYGGRCDCCGESHPEFLTIDHVDGGGARDRALTGSPNKIYMRIKREGFPPAYRLLCWNCNCARGAYGRCPHERAALELVA